MTNVSAQVTTVNLYVGGLSECPLSYSLQDSLGRSNIYLTQESGPAVYTMNFLVGATSSGYSLAPLQTVSTTEYHFKLSFSEDVFVTDGGYPAVADHSWKLLYDSGSIYLSWCGLGPEAIPSAVIRSLVVPIQYKATGCGDTNIIVTCYLAAEYCDPVGEQGKLQPCEQGIDFNVELVPRGVELAVNLVGNNIAVNDGKSGNAFTIRVSNPGSVAVPLDAEIEIFQIGFQTGSDAASLCTMAEFQNATLAVSDTLTFTQPKRCQGDNNLSAYWTVSTVDSAGLCIAPGEYVDFAIGGLPTSCPAGLATIFVRCVGVHSLGAHVYTVEVQKSPLLFPGPGTPVDGYWGLYIDYDNEVSSDAGGLCMEITTQGAAMSLSQYGAGSALEIAAGQSTTGYESDALSVSTDTTGAGLRVYQSDSEGLSAGFHGGAGVYISNDIIADDSAATAQDSSLYVQYTGNGLALKTDGDVEIGGNLVVKGTVTLQIDGMTVVLLPQSSPAAAGVEMAVQSSTGDLAALRSSGDFNEGPYNLGDPAGDNVVLMAAAPSGLGVSLEVQNAAGNAAGLLCANFKVNQRLYINNASMYFDSGKGLQLDNAGSKGPDGTVDTQLGS